MRYNIDKDDEEVYFPIPVTNFKRHHRRHHQQHHLQYQYPQQHHQRHQHHHHRHPNRIPKRAIVANPYQLYQYQYQLSPYNHLLTNTSPSSQSQSATATATGSPGSQHQQQLHQYQYQSENNRRDSAASSTFFTTSSARRQRMASKVEYVHSDQLMAATYVKNSKAIGFLWGVFSVCYAIISLVVFIQPQWIGARSPASSGYFGLWRHCAVASVMTETSTTSEFICRGRLDDFSSIINPAFRVATVFVGIAALVAILSVFGLILFICAPARQAYFIIALMQTIAAICTGVGLVVFPAGLDAAEVRLTCGPTADRFYLGSCTIRWAYVLAIIGLLDGAVLAVLGFVLGSRHLKLSDEFSSGSTRKIHSISGLNGYPHRGGGGYFYGTDSGPTPSVTYSYASTKRSTMGGALQPIVLLPPDQESEYRSKASLYRAEYATPKQNIQL